MKIGGIARYFCSVDTEQTLEAAFQFAREKKVPVVILGGGSNVLIGSGEINALVVRIALKGVEWRDEKETMLVVAGAGESWDGLVAEAVRRGLWGIENLSGIPGTVGAAPIQNIGAYGTEIKETIEWVEVFDTKTGKLRRLSNKECAFGYRDSLFKRPEGKSLVVTRVALCLKKNGVPNLEYKDLKAYFANDGNPSLDDIRSAILEIRSKKFPDLKKFGTAGSFFKNPIVSKEKFSELKKKFPDLPGFELRIKDKGLRIKVPLAWILDNVCHFKGYKKGNVSLFSSQPIVLVQDGNASYFEIEAFAKEICDRVKVETGIDIEWEVQKLN